ncbi:glycosyltransferase [Dyella sp. M7H15-1]|uniref:glycosyltransferase family 2 protein n=1 Tax=Dyella sp. M7H15-1 TaxID=2501295 RepID=UPI001004E8D1|nr:glycosyltransferase family 2 protein [Dyella sp. M7H15-1]QAU24064.1 glycosyltransferase [Dyella sp. M7H15-1]
MDTTATHSSPRVAVLVPCYNEEIAVPSVVRQFREALPQARICVFDNNSSDKTSEVARATGAEVHFVQLRGKGNVVRRMFADIDADIYVLVDGDATYDAASAPGMIQYLLSHRLDMVVGVRKDNEAAAYRRGHRLGNRMLTGCVSLIFNGHFSDMLSGYRVFSRRYVKSFPALSTGFETETELTVHALELRMPWGEMNTPYSARPEGSSSKLSTYKDGYKILSMIIRLYKSERPLAFFGSISGLLSLIAWGMAAPLFFTYFRTGEVPRIPTAVLVTGIQLLGFLSLACGLIVDTVTRGRQEMKLLSYLNIASESEKHLQREN